MPGIQAGAQQNWPPGAWGTGGPWLGGGAAPGVPGQTAPGQAGQAVPSQAGPAEAGPGPGAPVPGVAGPPVPAARDASRAPGPASSASGSELRWTMVAYLAVPFFGCLVPLAVYLTIRRRSPRVRAHAAQALNMSLTVLMYDVSAAIMAAMLALDSPLVAVSVAGPVTVALWLVALRYLVRAGNAAGRGEEFRLPPWLCASLFR